MYRAILLDGTISLTKGNLIIEKRERNDKFMLENRMYAVSIISKRKKVKSRYYFVLAKQTYWTLVADIGKWSGVGSGY